MDKKYRLCYDYYFLPSDPNNGADFKSEKIAGIDLMVRFKVFENGEEIFFKDEKAIFSSANTNKKYWIPNFIQCHYEPESKSFKFSKNLYAFQLAEFEGKQFSFEYKPLYYSKDVIGSKYLINISAEEFNEILKTCDFDTTDNKPAQNLAYCLKEIDK